MRENTKEIKIGNVKIGARNPIAIQSMTNTKTKDIASTVAQINALEEAGCEIVRVALVDEEDARSISKIKEQVNLPIVADIHFDYKLALLAIEHGADKIRINPGNISDKSKIKEIVANAKAKNIPIRVGVNGGSLEKNLLQKYNGITAEALAESAIDKVKMIEDFDYDNLVVSIKASNVNLAYESNKLIAEQVKYPLHLGITEAGDQKRGVIKSSVGLGMMLGCGFGDTIRVSLTGDPVNEIFCAKEILKSLDLRHFGIEYISCPTCGRTEIDLYDILEKVENKTLHIKNPIKVAIMGCVVNGPGEAKEADLGIAGGKQSCVLFKKGKIVDTFDEKDIVDVLVKEILCLSE